jgi:predicted TIM-barrel fold metal-dependent hydrolase
VDIHVHFDEKNPNFIRDFVAVAERINLTACLLTPYSHRVQVAEAAKQHPRQIVPFGFIDLDATDVLSQVKDFHELGYRGLGELEFVKRPYVDASYLPVYELANEYGWVLLFHTGIVLRRSVDQQENVASHRMRAFYLEEIARRFPKLTVIGAHCGNPEYEWAAEVARWNPNVFFDLSGSTLTKMNKRLEDSKSSSGGLVRENGKRKRQPTTQVRLSNWYSDLTAASMASKASSANIEPCSSPAMCLPTHSR